MTMSVPCKRSISAMTLVAMMTIFSCSRTPSTAPTYEDVVISASCGGGFILNSRTVSIYGNGKVTYDTVFGNIDSAGHKEAVISHERIIELVKKFHENSFFSLKDDCSCGGDIYNYITYYDPPEQKQVYGGNTWINVPGDTFCQSPSEYDTLWDECWKIKQELFP